MGRHIGRTAPATRPLERPAQRQPALTLGLREWGTHHGIDNNPGIKIPTMVILKTPGEIATMREAGRVVARTLAAVTAAAAPGVRLPHLDALAADTIAAHGAT